MIVDPSTVVAVVVTAMIFILLPEQWKTVIKGILKLLVMLIKVKLHTFYCKIWNYNFIDEFETIVDSNPYHIQFVIVETNRSVCIQEVDELSNQFAHWSIRNGFKQKDNIALVMSNRYELVALWLGMGKIGCSSSLININSTGKTLLHAINISFNNNTTAKKVVIFDREVHSKLSSGDIDSMQSEGVEVLVWECLNESQVSKMPVSRPGREYRNNIKESDVLLYIFTSGTTGMPKASKMSHSRVFLASVPFGTLCNIGPRSRIYTCLPLYHSAGGVLGVSTAIRYRACMVLRKKFSARCFASDCLKFNCNVFQYIGELCRYLVASSSSSPSTDEKTRGMAPQGCVIPLSIDYAFGNGLTSEIWLKFQSKYCIKNIVEFYLSTEGNCGLFNCFNKVGALGYVPRMFDFLYPVLILKISPENKDTPLRVPAASSSPQTDSSHASNGKKHDDSIRGNDDDHSDSSSLLNEGFCKVCEPNEVGLVVSEISEASVDKRFDGYSDTQATNKKVIRNVLRPNDAYFNTGDLMYRDQAGYFFFSDRSGDTFRWKGENVSTAEVGSVLGALPFIADVCVYGVTVPQCEGRAGMASIVPSPLTTAATAQDPQQLPSHAKSKHSMSFDMETPATSPVAAVAATQQQSADTQFSMDQAIFPWQQFEGALKAHLPAYAHPQFVRLMRVIPTTATFKHLKNVLVEQGYDPRLTGEDCVFFLDSSSGTDSRTGGHGHYKPMSQEVFDDIVRTGRF